MTASMNYLPWLVVQGAWVWRGALGLLFVGALVAAWLPPRWLARRQWRRAMRESGEPNRPSGPLDGKEITLIGQLRADGACERFEDGAEAAASRMDDPATRADARAPALTLDVDGTPVEIEGPLAVLAGSAEYRPGRSQTAVRGIRDRVANAGAIEHDRLSPPRGPTVFRSLDDGDRVVARGTLHVVAGESRKGYRAEGVAYTLRDVSIASYRAPRVRGPALLRWLQAVAVAGLVFLSVFGIGGAILAHIPEGRANNSRLPLPRAWRRCPASVWLAATPFYRAKALDWLEECLQDNAARKPAATEASIALHELAGDCAGALDVMLRHRQFRRVLSSGTGCGGWPAEETRARAALATGNLERASRALSRLPKTGVSLDDQDLELRVQLLAGHFAEASATAGSTARSLLSKTGWLVTGKKAVKERAGESAVRDCLANALAVRAGHGDALGKLQQQAQKHASAECRLLLADLQTGNARKRTLARVGKTSRDLQTCATLLGAEHDPVASAPDVLAVRPWEVGATANSLLENVVLPEFWYHGVRSGLEVALLDELDRKESLPPPARTLRARLRARAAAEASLILQHAEARRWLALARADDPSSNDACDFAALGALIELRADNLAAAQSAVKGACPGYPMRDVRQLVTRIAARQLPEELTRYKRLAAALHGDARPFVDHLQTARFDDDVLPGLLAYWLPVEVDADYLHAAPSLPMPLQGNSDDLPNLTDLSLLAEGCKDHDLAKETLAGVRHLRAALQRRDLAVPLAVIESQ